MPEFELSPLFPDVLPESRHRLSGVFWVIMGILVALGAMWLLLVFVLGGSQSAVHSAESETQPLRIFGDYVPQPRQVDWPEFTSLFTLPAKDLQRQLQTAIEQHPDVTIGVSVRALTDGEHIAVQEGKTFKAASVSKLITAAAALAMVDNHMLELDDQLGELTVEQHLQRMINQSDNASWDRLNAAVGLADMQAYADQIGLNGFTVLGNTATAHDMAVFMQMLYRYELLSESSTELLLSYMSQTNEERMLPAVFDQSDAVYHKYGWIENYVHDVGVVVHKGQPFVISIMTQGTINYEQGRKLVQEIATIVEQALR